MPAAAASTYAAPVKPCAEACAVAYDAIAAYVAAYIYPPFVSRLSLLQFFNFFPRPPMSYCGQPGHTVRLVTSHALALSLSLDLSYGQKKLSSQPGIPSCSLFYLLLLIPLLDTWYTCSPLLILVYAISLFTHDCPGSYRCFISSPSATRTINLLWVPLWRST